MTMGEGLEEEREEAEGGVSLEVIFWTEGLEGMTPKANSLGAERTLTVNSEGEVSKVNMIPFWSETLLAREARDWREGGERKGVGFFLGFFVRVVERASDEEWADFLLKLRARRLYFFLGIVVVERLGRINRMVCR